MQAARNTALAFQIDGSPERDGVIYVSHATALILHSRGLGGSCVELPLRSLWSLEGGCYSAQ